MNVCLCVCVCVRVCVHVAFVHECVCVCALDWKGSWIFANYSSSNTNSMDSHASDWLQLLFDQVP